jgi:hypothetical protein
MADRHYWIGVIAKDQVQLAVKAGIAHLHHGTKDPLVEMHAGDGFIFYSPKDTFPGGKPVQTFTGIGKVKTGQVYKEPNSLDEKPYEIEIDLFAAKETPIRPLIERLSFIEDKTHWGYPFRAGYLAIPEKDFRTIASAMGVHFETIFGM